MIGKTLGHYEITSQLGKGGMGEVYQAKDQKLGRSVAIKVLPEEFARDADRVARFQREAKLLASLNHPNIAAIHGLEESEGTNFLVLELVPGDTLADRLKRGPIPVEESLKLGLQIAEALEAAHEKGIIHRDLKPANIKVSPEGKVKVLDFGLAKALAGEQADLNLSNSPTLSEADTQKGVILGTAAYMSPEQAKGKSVDKRADIWAFGAVLLEMLTGRKIFAGETVSETLAAVLMKEADFSTLPPTLHPRIRFLLERCLEKEPKNRYHDISDVRVDIQKVLADPSGVLVQSYIPAAPKRKLRLGLAWVASIVVVSVIIAGVAVWKFKPSEPRQVMRFDYELPEGQQLSSPLQALAVSPDGKQFVYSTDKGLYIRSVNELTAKPIAGTEGAAGQPFFSPDGKSIGYFSVTDRQLKKIAVVGGAPVTLCAVNQLLGAWWSVDNTIVYGQLPGDLMQISADGGIPRSLIKMKSEYLAFPQILPDGKSVMYTAAVSTTQYRTMVQSPKLGEPKELFAGGEAKYLATGHIVYSLPNNNNLWAIGFDPDKLETKGGAVPVVEGQTQAAVSDGGTLVYIPGAASETNQSGRTLVWVNREGKETALGAPPQFYRTPKISPDGMRVALTAVIDGNADIYIWDPARETRTRLTFDEGVDILPVWTRDGKRIAYASDRGGDRGIFWKAADGTGTAEKLALEPGRALMAWCWSNDGKALVIVDANSAWSTYSIGTLSMEGDHSRKLLLGGQAMNPNLSRDGKYVAYLSVESGDIEIYVRPFPDADKGKWQVSNNGGESPLWSPDGRELFYLSNDGVMAVSVETEPTFKCGKPRVLFKGSYIAGYGDSPPWDISPDGKRFLMIKPPAAAGAAPTAAPRKINIVLNWFEELKQRVPKK
jgi:serine/threonine protein kinase/Tol biopolymer transport system component